MFHHGLKSDAMVADFAFGGVVNELIGIDAAICYTR